MVSLCQRLGVRPFVLEVESWSDNHVPANLHQTNFILCSDKKEQVLRHNLQPLRSRTGWEGRAQQAAPSWPGPQTLSGRHHAGSQAPRTQRSVGSGAQAPQVSHMVRTGLTDVPGKWPLPLGSRGRDWGEAHCHLKAWAWSVGSFGQASRALQDTDPACPLSHTPHSSSPAGPRTEGPREKAGIRFLPHFLL